MGYMYNSRSFKLKERVIGASRHSIQIEGDHGETIFCSNKVFNELVKNPDIQFDIVTVGEHHDHRTGRFYPTTSWIQAYIPTRF